MLDRVTDLSNECPLSLREGFKYLLEAIAKSYSDISAKGIVGSIFFLRFLCPAIISPAKYTDMDDEEALSPQVSAQLVLASKILLHIANKTPWESDHEYKELINNRIQMYQEKVSIFVEKLVDPATIEFGRTIIDASVSRDLNQDTIDAAEVAMRSYIENISNAHDLKLEYQNSLQRVRHLYDVETNWKLCLKDDGAVVYKLKEEGNSINTWKSQIKITLQNQDTLMDFLVTGNSLREDKRIEKLVMVERIDENTSDWLLTTKILWPMAARECLFRKIKIVAEKYRFVLDYSIFRKDTPITKHSIRSVIFCGSFIEVHKDCKPGEVLFTQLWMMDPKGSIPTWIVNKGAAGCMKYLKNMRHIAVSRQF